MGIFFGPVFSDRRRHVFLAEDIFSFFRTERKGILQETLFISPGLQLYRDKKKYIIMVHTKVTEVSVKMADETKRNIPLLPLRGLLVYPTMVLHLDVGREKSVQALEQAMMNDHMIFLATQKDISIDEPDEDEIFTFGTYTKIKQMLKLPNGTIRVWWRGCSAPHS